MKRLSILLSALFVAFVAAHAHAMVYNFNTSSLNTMSDSRYYSWNITNSSLSNDLSSNNEVITSGTITISNINNTLYGVNTLYMDLLLNDSYTSGSYVGSGVYRFYDSVSGDDWGGVEATASGAAGSNVLLDTWSDGNGPYTPDTITYNLSDAELAILNERASDGKFALGFDSDCYYKDENVQFSLTTGSVPAGEDVVPEPATILLLGSGLVGLAAFSRRRTAS